MAEWIPEISAMGERLSFADSGAVGNGITDDYAVLQAFITGNNLYTVPADKIYAISQALSLPSHCGLTGSGTIKLLNDNANGAVLTNNTKTGAGNDYLYFGPITVRGSSNGLPKGDTPGAIGIYLRNVHHVTFVETLVTYVGAIGIAYQMASDVTMNKVVTSYTGRDGIGGVALNGGLRDISLTDCTVYYPGDDGFAIAASHAAAGNQNGTYDTFTTMAGSAVVTAGTGGFTAANIGQTITIDEVGQTPDTGTTMPYEGVISAVNSSSEIEVSPAVTKAGTDRDGYYDYEKPTNIRLTRCRVYGWQNDLEQTYGRGFLVIGASDTVLTDCYCEYTFSSGYSLGAATQQVGQNLWSDTVTLDGCVSAYAGAYGLAPAQPEHGFRIEGLRDSTLENCLSIRPEGSNYVVIAANDLTLLNNLSREAPMTQTLTSLTDVDTSSATTEGAEYALRYSSTVMGGYSLVTTADPANEVTAASNLTDNAIVRGDGGAKGIQTSGITIDDSNNLVGVNSVTISNTGLKLLDTNASHTLAIVPGSNITANKTLTIITGDLDQTLDVSAVASTGKVLQTNGTTVALAQVNGGSYGFNLENDFLYYNGTMPGVNQQVSGTSAAGGAGTGTANHPGLAALTTGTDTTGRAGLFGASAGILLGGGALDYTIIIRTPSALSDGTDTYTIYSGLNDAATGDGTDGVFFRYTHSANSGKWQCVTRSNSTETVGDGAITVATSTFYKFRIVVNAAATSVDFYIDDVLKVTQTTNIPTGTGRETGLLPANIVKSAGTTARQMDIDYFKIFQYFTTAR